MQPPRPLGSNALQLAFDDPTPIPGGIMQEEGDAQDISPHNFASGTDLPSVSTIPPFHKPKSGRQGRARRSAHQSGIKYTQSNRQAHDTLDEILKQAISAIPDNILPRKGACDRYLDNSRRDSRVRRTLEGASEILDLYYRFFGPLLPLLEGQSDPREFIQGLVAAHQDTVAGQS